MIGYFPDPYPDELFYSLSARFSDHMHYSTHSAVLQDLFDYRLQVKVDLPDRLGALAAALPPGHVCTLDRLIDDHTLLPLYTPFLSPAQWSELRESMQGNHVGMARRHAGLLPARVLSPEFLQFCPCCVEEDRLQWGECYWHRLHQVPGVEVCPVHSLWLERSGVCVRYPRNGYEFVSAERAIPVITPRPMKESDLQGAVLLRLARDSAWLLGHPGPAMGYEPLHKRYIALLADHGLASYQSELVRTSLLVRTFQEYYPSDLLARLRCQMDALSRPRHWLKDLVQDAQWVQLPLHHLLLMQFLGCTAETFFSLPVEPHPFGEGPWPCLNPGSEHYRQFLVQECCITYSRRTGQPPIGQFACDCGFVYYRVGPDRSPEDRFRSDGVRSLGATWEETLRKLWQDPTVSVKRMAHQLGVDVRTVKRSAVSLGLSFPRLMSGRVKATQAPAARPPTKTTQTLVNQDEYRAIWLSFVAEHPEACIHTLQGVERRVWQWLHKHDKAWLAAHMPPKTVRKKSAVVPPRVNWEERDAQLVEVIRSAALHLKAAPGRPVQVTAIAIGREIGQVMTLKYKLYRFPRAAQLLKQVVEPARDYAVRRVWWAAECYRAEQICPTYNQFLQRASVFRAHTARFPEVQEAIESAFQMLLRLQETRPA